MPFTSVPKPTTSHNSVSKPSVLQSPRIDRVSSTINSISSTIDGYSVNIYDSVSSVTTAYNNVAKPT